MKGFKYGDYEIFPAGQQLKNNDGSPAKWMALACIVHWKGNEVQAIPVSWYPPDFDTEQAAGTHAAAAAKEMIDAGRCKI